MIIQRHRDKKKFTHTQNAIDHKIIVALQLQLFEKHTMHRDRGRSRIK